MEGIPGCILRKGKCMTVKHRSDIAAEYTEPPIAFVWRAGEITHQVILMAQQTGSRAIFDLSGIRIDELGVCLRTADQAGLVRDIKISLPVFLEPSLKQVLLETGVRNIWVECHPPFVHADYSSFLQKMRELADDYHCFPISGDIGLITAVIKENSGSGSIVLKGCEASGFVGGETTLALYALAREMLSTSSDRCDIHIWGGVSTPEAAAAFLATGASGIVFESLHWLTDMVAIDDTQRQRISKLRLDTTTLAGLGLQVPYRLFNKGNSRAFKEIQAFEDSLCGAEIQEESRRNFASRMSGRAVHPLESRFSPDEVIPLGVEAASAAAFIERYGELTAVALKAFIDEIAALCRLAGTKRECYLQSPVAAAMGTVYPFIQGAMSWISEVPEFARNVADAGGLPTIALGMMDAETLDRKLGRLPEIMGERPYAVNVVSLAENPYREIQLAWIRKLNPRFVVIAGGDLTPLKELLQSGTVVMYIAPDEALLRLALEAGVQYVVCEGYDAGGHVGQLSTLTLAQMVLELKRRSPSLFQNCRVVLAGGICNRETAFMAAVLGADAIQMGTAYLATREIVETGALAALYQRLILESAPGGTVVSGQHTGLRVRSLKTPRVEALLSLEREFAAGSQDEASFRSRMEELSAGSLFIAARGCDRPDNTPLDEQTCRERGQFMTGTCAGLISGSMSLTAFHHELAEGVLELHHTGTVPSVTMSGTSTPASGRSAKPPISGRDTYERIAITGMSMLNALGNNPEDVWAASLAMKSGITLVPPSRWDHSLYYDPRPRIQDKTCCAVGAFLDFHVSRTELGIPPQDFRSMTSATKLTMWLADKAIRDSGILESGIPRERIGVLVSQNSGEAAGTLTDIIIRAYVNDILASVKKAIPLTPEQEGAIIREVRSGRMASDDTTLLGRLNCAAAGFICNRYGFMGPSYAVSAACSTSLVALYSAIQMIRNGIIDAAIVGGAEDDLTHLHFLEFAAVGALYGLSGRERPAREASRPFDAERDGLVLGEGGGMIVIEREGLARARGAQINAIITGMGASNNNLGMVESSSISQELAIRASFAGIPYGPDAVGLVECHATSTRQGDVEEVRALKTFFNSSERTVLTSFKSQIGHTLGASGINNLIRGAMAMKSGIFPATLNYEHPDPEMGLEGSGLVVAPEPFDWKRRDGQPRRLQVNAFGFGGSNYVLQMEQDLDDLDTVMVSPEQAQNHYEIKADDSAALLGVFLFQAELDSLDCRMAVVAQTGQEARTIIEASAVLKEGGVFSPKVERTLSKQGIYVRRENLPVLPLAFVFPGQGAQYAGMGRDLYESFPVIREWMDRAAAAADFDLLQLLFHDREQNLLKTRWQQPALFALEHAMARYLISLGVRPVAMAGHSLGELTALCLAGVFSAEDGFRIVNMRAICMDKAAAMNVEPGIMAAVDAPLDLLEELISGQDQVHIGNINSPKQVVMSGTTEAVRNLSQHLKSKGYRATLLPVSMAFHSPIMRVIHNELQAFVDAIPFHPPQIPVISNTTMAAYPSDPAEIKRILMSHLESPVHWMNNVQSLWNDHGVRLFVEVGPGDILSSLIADTLAEPTCIQTCLPAAESSTYRGALAQLYAHGRLKPQVEPDRYSLPASGTNQDAHASAPESRVQPQETLETATPEAVKQIVAETPASAPVIHAPVPADTSGGQELMETLIGIIMDATGYERDEIRPEMDLRKDLSIRSSRLPIIMDAAERQFGITIDLEDFIEVRTVDDIAQRISVLMIKQGVASQPSAENAADPVSSAIVRPAPASGETSGGRDLMERLIRIIMDATGYERDEIQPEMDLRKDLSIRSSRLPIIMDAAERQFGITIDLEDFIEVRTVDDIARRIAGILGGQEGSSFPAAGAPAGISQVQPEIMIPQEDEAPVQRLVFRQTALELADSIPLKLAPGESVLLLAPERDDGIAGRAGEILRSDHGVDTVPLLFMPGRSVPGDAGYDLLTDQGSDSAAERISSLASLAGMVVTLPQPGMEHMADVPRLLRGLFIQLKAFLRSPSKKFVLLIHPSGKSDETGRLLAEGLLGLFLSAAQEYPSVQFRTLETDGDTDLRVALRTALDRSCPVVEMIHRGGRVFTSQGHIAPVVFSESTSLSLNPGDVVVISGGASGISALLARSLAPFMPRLVFLGRTVLESGFDPETPRSGSANPELSAAGRRRSEIASTLAELRYIGIEASYHSCDVSDPEAVRTVLGAIVGRYGRIDGIIHGAGLLRDGLLCHMTPDEFSPVIDVKFLGAWNLFSAAERAGLKLFVALSSAAAIQGNPGQANYAAANRMMSALLKSLRLKNNEIVCKALMLPPVEGTGMAENPELRELLKRKGVAYIHGTELAGLFCRELFAAPADDDWVLFMRKLPALKTVLLDDAPPPAPLELLDAGTVTVNPEDAPMIEQVSLMDLHREKLEAFRTFSPDKDLWLADHRPFTFIKHPLVSATMVLETFMEAAKILYPYLQVRGVRTVRLMDMIECPPGLPRPAKISCQRVDNGLREIVCDVSLSTQDISPVGRLIDRFTPYCMGQVILDGGEGYLGVGLPGFPVRREELQSAALDQSQVLQWYKDRSGLDGRYRVMDSIEGAGPGVVRGRTTCRNTIDFAHLLAPRYQYSPYLFEALLQLAGFYTAVTDSAEHRSMVPMEVGEMRFLRQCREGEQIILEARLRTQDTEGLVWDARGVDGQGCTIMQVYGMRMQWVLN